MSRVPVPELTLEYPTVGADSRPFPPVHGPGKESPTASFGMPVYNGAKYLDRALESLLSQTFDDFELIVSDNGSTDGSPDIVARYADEDPRVTLITSPVNRGAAWNFRQVFLRASGRYFAWTAADDYWDPRFLEAGVVALDAHPDAVTCVTGIQPISSLGTAVGGPYDGLSVVGDDPRSRWRSALRNSLLHAATYGLTRREALGRTRLILAYIGTDHVLMTELALQGNVIEVPEILAYKLVPGEGEKYRSHADALGYLGGPSRAPWFLWARVTKELVSAVRHVQPDDCSVLLLSLDAVASYFSVGFYLNDVKNALRRLRPVH